MSIRYQGAGMGVFLALGAALILVGFCLWGVISLMRRDLQGQNGVLPASPRAKDRGGQ